jgi:maltose alpha-D-glucosyltransferase/alpha-amylase
VAVVHDFVENQGDAWTVISSYLDRVVDEQRLLTESENDGESEEQAPYLHYLSQAGRRLAELHMALSSHREIADFAPEPIRAADVRRWLADATAHAEHVLDLLKARRETIKEADRALVDRLQAQRATLRDRLAALLPPEIDGMNIRLHGDFNLGRILIVKDDICIAGFDGEPRRTLAERRRKAPAARDVAGLLRSIDYSATAALERALKVAPDEHGRLAAAVAEWRERAASAFLASYRETVTNLHVWPDDPKAAGQMLNFFMLERALCEIEYETAHRPDWLRVPLTGLLRMLSQQPNESP